MMDEELVKMLVSSSISSTVPTPTLSGGGVSGFYEDESMGLNSSSEGDILESTSSSTGFGMLGIASYNDSGGFEYGNSTGGIWNSTSDLMDLDWAKIILVILFCGIIAGTVIGNTLVIAAVATTKKLRTVTNCFVMSLALADWLVGMFVMPPKVLVHLSGGGWKFGSLVCEIWIFLDVLLCTSSILSLCTISIDRYLAITRPLAYSRKRRSKRLALGMISCVWVGSFVITCPAMFTSKKETQGSDSCEYNDDEIYVVYSALGSFFLPLLVMLYVYARIACVIARRQKTIQKLHKSKDKDKKYCDSDDTLPVDGLIPPNSAKHETNTGAGTPTTSSLRFTTKLRQTQSSSSTGSTIKFLKRSKITPRSGSSIWSRFRRLKSGNNSSSRKWKPNNSPVGSAGVGGGGDKDDIVDPSHVPSPSTILGMGNGSGSRGGNNGSSHHQHNQILARTCTGSRLCHHNSTTPSSPPRCIINSHRNTPDNDNFTRTHQHYNQSHHLHHPVTRVWTVGDEDQENRQELITHSNLSIAGSGCGSPMSNFHCSCTNHHQHLNLLGTNSIDDLTKGHGHGYSYGPSHSSVLQTTRFTIMKENRYRTITTTTQPHQHSATRQSSCSTLLGDPSGANTIMACSSSPSINNRNNSVLGRSKSVKGNINFALQSTNDQNQNASNVGGRDFTAGRVASFKRESKTAQTLAAVVGGFVICWLPFFVAYVVNPITGKKIIPDAIMEAFVWLGWSNSFINPFIYSFYSADFRSAFWRLTFHKCSGLFNCKNKKKNFGGGMGAGVVDRTSPKRYEHEMNQQNQNIRTSPN